MYRRARLTFAGLEPRCRPTPHAFQRFYAPGGVVLIVPHGLEVGIADPGAGPRCPVLHLLPSRFHCFPKLTALFRSVLARTTKNQARGVYVGTHKQCFALERVRLYVKGNWSKCLPGTLSVRRNLPCREGGKLAAESKSIVGGVVTNDGLVGRSFFVRSRAVPTSVQHGGCMLRASESWGCPSCRPRSTQRLSKTQLFAR